MNGDSTGSWCNYCDKPGHWYAQCALVKFDELGYQMAKNEELARSTPYPGESVMDHMWQAETGFEYYEYPDVGWGSFWATEPREGFRSDSGYDNMQGPDDWYAGEGCGDS